ncbi:MAG: CBS domain-containing protein [Candidatus Diapherotrites archaeon]|nr:CBS domain-containing protein [Candidatus Diapherotrites archaeon]
MAVGVKVADAMRKSVVTVSPSDLVQKALEYMVDLDIGSVVVVENKKAVGILTDSNILERVVIKKMDPEKVSIKEVMSHPLRTVSPDIDIEEASRVMRDLSVKRLPVEDNGRLVGIITEADIIAMAPALFDIVKEMAELRCGLPEEASDKTYSGVCESCGNFSDGLRRSQGKLVCEDCWE